jgi:hypothetical protein
VKGYIMRELTMNEIEEVSGGLTRAQWEFAKKVAYDLSISVGAAAAWEFGSKAVGDAYQYIVDNNNSGVYINKQNYDWNAP